ncbi:cytoskeleton protein RodZ [Vibrio fluvialis]|uniref:cytoskeleton protein RodZ n=1 Tax=Vibrio fluvialis TaxID=676 RepID=UPI001F2D7DA3|nr:cytoskeleton protein RodZ [Vibrio fluvialis]MCE7613015.1 cytoskeleton protein RodZ [Vibrio fluvialis]
MNTEQDNITESTPKVQPGTLLKEKREALGLTQKQVADRLRLRVTIIQNIEENNFDSDLVATFTRGYLRSYAKAVGLAEHLVLDAFEESVTPEPQEQTMQSFSKKTKREKHDSRIMTITWIILLVIIGMSSLWWWQNNEQDTLKPDQGNEAVSAVADQAAAPATEEVQPKFNTIEPTQAEAQSDAQPSEEPTGDEMAMEDPAPAQEEAVVEPQTTPAAPAAAEATSGDLLTMNFSSDCWVQVKDATGKTLSTGIKKAGETLNLRGQKPLQVILGAPEGVSVTFASEPVDLSGYTSGKVARFTLP